MVVVLTHKEKSNLVVCLFDNLVGPLLYNLNIGDIKVFAYTVCCNVALA